MIESKAYFEQHEYRDPQDPVVAAYVQPKLKFIESRGCLKQGTKILDVGSGNGTFSHYLSKYADVVCLDYSSQLIGSNRCNAKVRASAYELPFADKSFEVVFEANLLHHLDEPDRAMREMARCSSRYAVVIEPNRYNPLMFLFSLAVPAERGGLLSSRNRWLDAIRKAGFTKTESMVTGMISQQNTPKVLLPILKAFDFNFPFGEYIVMVGEKPNER